jgi:hypothetical protein
VAPGAQAINSSARGSLDARVAFDELLMEKSPSHVTRDAGRYLREMLAAASGPAGERA